MFAHRSRAHYTNRLLSIRLYFLQFTLALLLQLLERIQDSVSGIGESMATISAVSNLERRLDALEGQAAENQCNLVRSSLLLASS